MTQPEKRTTRKVLWPLTLLGGLLIGVAASLPLALIWPYPDVPSACIDEILLIHFGAKFYPFPCMPTFMFVQPLVWGSFLAAGALFGLLAHHLVGVGSHALVTIVGGVSFFLAVFIGAEVVRRLPNPEVPIFFASSTAAPFAIMSFGASLTVALAIGLVLHTRGLLWRALVAATVTAICYWLVAWIIFGRGVMLFSHDLTTPPLAFSLPELGRPMGPMMKTTLISNFVAGTIGGATILFLFTVPSRAVPRPSARTGSG